MNKKLKLLQRPKVLKTLEVEKVKHDLSKIENSTIVMVAYDDAADKFLIGDNSGDLYVATSEYLNSLDIKNLNINSFINKLTKSSISEHFNKITLQEAKEMFGDRYVYYWTANNKIYGVKKGIIEQLDNGPDNTKVVELWDRTENVLSNDRGVTGLKEVKFSAELRPAFLTFSEAALPTYNRDNNLIVRDPVKIADTLNKDLQNYDYVPDNDKYGYDMKDSNAVMKAYLGTDDLVVLSNIDKREVVDIDPPTVDPDNADVVYTNNTPFNHNYNMVWSTIRSARLFEAFNDEIEDDNPNFVNMTRHEQNELTTATATATATATRHVDASGLYANIPNLANTYTTYIEGDRIGEKQLYNAGNVGVSIKNEIMWSLDSINGTNCVVTKRIYNSITGEVENAKRTYNAVIDYTIDQIKDNTCKIKKEIRVPILNNAICDIHRFEQKLDSSGTAISLPVPNEFDDGIVEYSLDTSNYSQGTNGTISYGLRKIFIQSGATKVLLGTTSITGTADFSVYTLGSNATTATIKRLTEVVFKNTDGTNYNFKTSNNGIGTGTVSYSVAAAPTSVSGNNHRSKHTRIVLYLSGSTNVTVQTDSYEAAVSYKIYNLNAGATTATLKGSSVGVFDTIKNGARTNENYNIAQNDHITVISNVITYSLNSEVYKTGSVTCSQNMNVTYTYGGVTIKKVITKSANINHSLYTLEANATTAKIKRTFTPVFYTISAGVESTVNIFKNNVVDIDNDKVGIVSFEVSDTPTNISGANHTATHTRKVTYTQNNVSVEVFKDTYNAVVSYKIYTLNAGVTAATLKGSSTGVFNTYLNGTKQTSTYNVVKTNHISVTSAAVVWSDSAVAYTSKDSVSCTRTATFSYTYSNVKISLSISKSAAVSHSLASISQGAAYVYRKYSPKFYTIANGSETSSVYTDKTITIDTPKATLTHTASSSVTSVSGSSHFATHTRKVTYTPTTNITYDIHSDTTSASISYTWKNLSASSKQFYGSSTGTFNVYSDGDKTDKTYTVSQTNHMTVDCEVSTANVIDSYTNTLQQAHLKLTGSYTNNKVTKTISINSSKADITSSVYTLSSSNIYSATIKRSYTATIKEISNGTTSSSNYISETKSLGDVTASVSYGSLTKAETGTGTAISRTISYKCSDNSIITYMTTSSSNSNGYTLVKHTGSTVTFYNTIYARFNAISDGKSSTTVYAATSISSDTKTASVSYHTLNMYSEWSGDITVKAIYNNVTIYSTTFTPTITYNETFTTSSKTFTGNRKITASKNLTSSVSGSSPITYSYSDTSTNSVSYSYMCQNTDITSSGYLDVYPVMSAAANLTFKKISGGSVQSTTYNRSVNYNHSNKTTINIKPNVNYSYSSSAAYTINYLSYGTNGNYIYVKGANTTKYKAGTAVTGSVTSVTHTGKGSLSGSQGSATFTVKTSATWNSISLPGSTTVTSWFNGTSYLANNGGSMYNWSVYDYTNTITCTKGTKSASARYRSNNYTRTDKYKPSSSNRSVKAWWSEAYSF